MANKRYYWLKLHDDFFKSKRIKKLRKLGSDFVIIYLKMQLLSLQNNGIIEFSGIEDDFASEIALDIDEDEDKVQLTISYLQSCGLLECTEDNELFLPYVEKLTGSETQSTIRSRKSRQNKALEKLSIQNALQCNTNVTKCNREKDIEIDIDKDTDTNKSICVSDEGQKKFDLDNAFKLFFDKYPKKNRPAVAKTEFLNMMIDVIPSQHEELCKSLWKGMMLYLETKEKEGKLDYLPNFDKWLIEDSTYWMEQAERIENEQTS